MKKTSELKEIRTVDQLARKHGLELRDHTEETAYSTGSYDLTSAEYNVRIVYGFPTRTVRGGIFDNQANKPILFGKNELAFIQCNGMRPMLRELDNHLTELKKKINKSIDNEQ